MKAYNRLLVLAQAAYNEVIELDDDAEEVAGEETDSMDAAKLLMAMSQNNKPQNKITGHYNVTRSNNTIGVGSAKARGWYILTLPCHTRRA